ncbi:MAG: hypothetical protein H6830_03840 [Planctomycetes bacterium]|nr:hypothetical protein [Planctomycetota bacterium]HPF15096.1 hypothetical protein [Planctomycetota bacterium]
MQRTKFWKSLGIGVSCAALALPLVLAQSPGRARWQANSGMQLQWEATHDLTTTMFVVENEGESPVVSTLLPTLRTRDTRHISDWCEASDADRPLRIRRAMDTAELWGRLESGTDEVPPVEITMRSPLGAPETTVRFDWVPEEALYGKLYDANAAPEELLRGLRLDQDLSAFFPAKQGDADWSIPPAAMLTLLSPGGDLAYQGSEPDKAFLSRTMGLGFGGSLEELVGNPMLRGSVTGRWDTQHADASEGEAHVLLDFDLISETDQRDLANRLQLRAERALGMRIEKALVGFRFQGQGRLVWDLERGMVKTYHLEGVETLELFLVTETGDTTRRTEKTSMTGTLSIDALAAPLQKPLATRPWTEKPAADPETPR